MMTTEGLYTKPVEVAAAEQTETLEVNRVGTSNVSWDIDYDKVRILEILVGSEGIADIFNKQGPSYDDDTINRLVRAVNLFHDAFTTSK